MPISRVGEVTEGGVGDFAIDYPDTLGVPSGRYARERLSSAGQQVPAPGERWRASFPSQAPFLGEISQREADVSGIIPRIGEVVAVPDMAPPSRLLPLDQLVTEPRTIVPKEYADAILPTESLSNLSTELQDALTSGIGGDIADAFIEAQVKKAQAEADEYPGTISKQDYAEDKIAQSILDKVYDWGGAFNLPSAKKIVEWATTPEVVAREERYPLAPQEWGVDDAGLADRQWIDPHPQAINVDLGEYYKIPPDKRHLFKKPPESRWDVSKSGGSVWDRERRAAIEGRGMVDEFGQIQAEQDALDKISADRDAWWAQAHAVPDTYGDELPEYDQYGTLAGMQEGIGMVQGIPDPLQRVETAPIVPQVDVLDQPWMGVDEDALPYDIDTRYGDRRKEVGDFDNFVGDDKFRTYINKNPDAVEGLPQESVSTLLNNPALQEAYLRERWYLTNQRFFARDYKRDELFRTPGPKGHMVSREPEFFKLM
jgi:hypothetical protein